MAKSRRPRMPDARIDLDFSEIKAGSVVIHEDSEGSHFAIVLELTPRNLAYILMFSSKLTSNSRSLTKEEIALAGFVSSKKTFISLKVRPTWELKHKGIEFPRHRIEDLKREFLSNPSEREHLLDLASSKFECCDH